MNKKKVLLRPATAIKNSTSDLVKGGGGGLINVFSTIAGLMVTGTIFRILVQVSILLLVFMLVVRIHKGHKKSNHVLNNEHNTIMQIS